MEIVEIDEKLGNFVDIVKLRPVTRGPDNLHPIDVGGFSRNLRGLEITGSFSNSLDYPTNAGCIFRYQVTRYGFKAGSSESSRKGPLKKGPP